MAGRGVQSVVLILGLTGWTGIYRLVRAEFIKHSVREYVRAAEAIGASTLSRMFRHILPNVSHVALVQLSIHVVGFIKAEVILSYLGLGVGVDQVSWGTMLAEAQSELILGHWWQLAAATLFMAVFVTAFSLFTDALRDALDPEAARARVSVAAASRTCASPSASARPAASSQRVQAVGRGELGVSFEVPENTTVALVGESGSGKSVTAMSILNLLPDNAERSGRIEFLGRDLLHRDAARAAGAARQGHRLRVPGPDDLAEPGVHASAGRSASRCGATSGSSRARRWRAPRRCWSRSACPSRSGASAPTRTSCRAASSSA